jgi:HK97 family phage portal protein
MKVRRIPTRRSNSAPSARKTEKSVQSSSTPRKKPLERSQSRSTRKPAKASSRSVGPSYRPSEGFPEGFFGGWDETTAGMVVNEDTAMNYSAVYAAISLISECLAILPRKIYKSVSSDDDNDRTEMKRHPAWKILNRSPDKWRTSYSLFETMTAHAALTGNGFAEIIRNGRGQAIEAHLLNPYSVHIEVVSTGSPIYHVTETNGGGPKELEPWQVLHLRAPTWDGFIGKSPVTRARESIGLGLAAERFGSKYYSGGHVKGFLTKPNRIGRKEKETLRQEWYDWHGNLDNAFNVGILSGGMDWRDVGMSNTDAQFLQTRKFQVIEIARWFRIPPHMLAELDRATMNNIEHLLIEFVTFTMLPWVRRWESEMDMKFFTEDEQYHYYTQLSLDGLLRADSKSRAESLERQLRNGVLTPDEWRAMENRPAHQNGIGAKPLIMASQLMTLDAVANGQGMLDKQTPKKPTKKKVAANAR